VWFWQRDVISVHVLGRDGYTTQLRSACLPGLDLALLCRLAAVEPMSETIKQLRAMLLRG